jgi:light-regulated signal transduction histidine kinase (bacteriophytochrome)
VNFSPPFGHADLSNCERELIHLAGSIQPHGILFALSEGSLHINQVSKNVASVLQVEPSALLQRPLGAIDPGLERVVRSLVEAGKLDEPMPLRCELELAGSRTFEGYAHRSADGQIVVEVEPLGAHAPSVEPGALMTQLNRAVEQLSAASTVGALSDAAARCLRDIIGYDRVMIYKFDPDGHGKIIAEARDPRLEPLLGHHYPASDIPQRARELYLKTRLRVLVDVNYQPAALIPRHSPDSGQELDMSLCYLRSMSPLHLQYLKNMGVTATLVASLVGEGRLWGLIACHHYSPRNLSLAVRAASDLVAEVVSTRILAIENYAQAQVAIQVRRLEQRLVEATSTEGDWRLALFRNPHTLLQPVDATAAALFYDGEIMTTGEAPSTIELRALVQWINQQSFEGAFSCSSVAQANPQLASLTASASGVLAVRLSNARQDYLMWFRREQLVSVTWAGDPTKPVVGDDPMELSPRRSFAAWSEIVRGTALPWSKREETLARAFATALIDIIAQVSAVRLLIAEQQLAQVRDTVACSEEPVLIVGADRRTVFASKAFSRLLGGPLPPSADVSALFEQRQVVEDVLEMLATERRSWRGELLLEVAAGEPLPVSVRAEVVPARDGSVLGFFFLFADLSEAQRTLRARGHLEASLAQSVGISTADNLMSAILSNARLAAMDIADGATTHAAPRLEELEVSARRATVLYGRIREFGQRVGQDE